MSSTTRIPARFTELPASRVLGATASWFLFALNFALLFQATTVLLSIGGVCARGGPYVIEVQCPDEVVLFAPLSIFGGLFAVAVSMFLARGFGPSLLAIAWPTLFVGLGSLFLTTFFVSGDWTGLLVGVMFIAMGIVPLVLVLRASPQSVILGSVNSRGERFATGPKALRSSTDGRVTATTSDWMLSLGILVVASGAGVLLARVWFTAF